MNKLQVGHGPPVMEQGKLKRGGGWWFGRQGRTRQPRAPKTGATHQSKPSSRAALPTICGQAFRSRPSRTPAPRHRRCSPSYSSSAPPPPVVEVVAGVRLFSLFPFLFSETVAVYSSAEDFGRSFMRRGPIGGESIQSLFGDLVLVVQRIESIEVDLRRDLSRECVPKCGLALNWYGVVVCCYDLSFLRSLC
jgi:hypothetical protein